MDAAGVDDGIERLIVELQSRSGARALHIDHNHLGVGAVKKRQARTLSGPSVFGQSRGQNHFFDLGVDAVKMHSRR